MLWSRSAFQAGNLYPTRRILRREASRGEMTLSISGFILLVLKYGGFPCREFARWKVNNLALERKDFFSLPLPLAPEFVRNIRLLGRRPNLQQVTENLIKKYGTHFLLSATLGGKQHSRSQPTGCSTAENSFYDLLNIILSESFLPFWLIIAGELFFLGVLENSVFSAPETTLEHFYFLESGIMREGG